MFDVFRCRWVARIGVVVILGVELCQTVRATPLDSRGVAPAAIVDVDPPGDTINGSTYGSSSFRIANASTGGQRILSVRLDFRTAVFPDMVFDPEGRAGDTTAKAFRADAGAGETGPVTHVLSSPHDDGFDVIEVHFGGFDPGETFTFSIDVDPTSIRGVTAPGPQESGSVSGLELAGSGVTVVFSDQTTLRGNLFRTANSLDAARCVLRPGPPPAPTLSVLGVLTPPAVVTAPNKTARVVAPPGSHVRLVIVEGGLYTQGLPGGGFDLDPFESNSAAAVQEHAADVPAGGSVDIPVVLTQAGAAAGINHLVAAIETAPGETGPTSQTIVLQLGSGLFGVTPGSLTFGGWAPGSMSPAQVVTLSNGGNAPVRIQSITLGGEDPEEFAFTAPATPFDVGPGASVLVNVLFQPIALGDRRATLNLASPDLDETIIVTLAGRGFLADYNAMLVVADPSNLDPRDAARRDLLTDWNIGVNLIDDNASQATYDELSATVSAAYVSETVLSGAVGAKLTSASIGVVNEEPLIQDDLGVASAGGSSFTGSQISIGDVSHYVTSPFAMGPLTILTADGSLTASSGTAAAGCRTLGTRTWDGARVLMIVEAGGLLTTGQPSPGRRVLMPWGGNAFAFERLNEDGRTLLHRALNWAAGRTGCDPYGVLRGDANRDGVVDGRDIATFVDMLLATPPAGPCEADVDGDGAVDVRDVGPFVGALTHP